MSMGSIAGLGGGLSIGPDASCICIGSNPILYPPNACCPGNGNGCSNNGDGGGGLGLGVLGIGPPGGGNGSGGNGGTCCSNNGNGPFLGPGGGSGGGSCSCGNGGDTPQGNGGNDGIVICLEGTYGGGRGSVPTPMGNIRNGAVLLPLSLGIPASQPPCTNPIGTNPSAVVGSGAPYSVFVICQAPGQDVSGLLIRCTETGVTLPSVCNGVTTFFENVNATMHFTSLQGTATNCINQVVGTFGSGTGSGTSGMVVIISVSPV